MSLQPLYLRAQADRRIKKGHLWIYSNEVDTQRSPLTNFNAGELVQITANQGKPLGVAFVNPNALICGRLLSRDPTVNINETFITRRLERALALREMVFTKPYYRLCYGDSDLLPGLVIDRFGEHCVVQISSAGFDLLLPLVLNALQALLAPQGIVVRNNHNARELEGLDDQLEIIGDVPEFLTLWENNTQFQVPATTGQKTGWFYDHRANRAFLQQCVEGKSVLDVFSYVGGWGVQAAVAGAAQVTCVDSSQAAVEAVLSNAKLNGVEHKVQVLCDKALEVLKALLREGSRFDVIVLDPPAFIKKRKDQKAGEAAYRHINELAIRLLHHGGLLVSGSCSMPLQDQTLIDIVQAAAHNQNRVAQLIHTGSQSACHPVHSAIPETRYLKALFFCV